MIKRFFKMAASQKSKIRLLLLLFSTFFMVSGAYAGVSGYKSIFRPYYDNSGRVTIAIRRFNQNNKPRLLTIDPYTFDTYIISTEAADLRKEAKKEVWQDTPFVKALYRYASSEENRLQNSGITKGEEPVKGVFLTADLCPSKKTFDREMFLSTIGLPGLKDAPRHIALAVSGRWIEKHKDEFDWILKQVKSGRLDVTWVNHSYTHPYDSSKPVEGNFMLAPGVDFEKEVLSNEVLMIENGIVPTPFFRFPGLVSDAGLLEKLKKLSLIPIGSSAWLAKGEAPVEGSIILVHGNGNEPAGINRLLEFYREKRVEFQKGNIELLPLKDAFSRGK